MHLILHYIKAILKCVRSFLILLYLQVAYQIARICIKRYSKFHPIKVLFFVSEIAKWKAQHLYDLLESDNRFIPIICVYPMQREMNFASVYVANIIEERKSYFNSKGMRVISIWNSELMRLDASAFREPGIIFYQQTWDTPPAPKCWKVALSHLTFYMPYYLVNGYNKDLDLCMDLQRQVYRYIVQCKDIVEFYHKEVAQFKFAGKIIGLGHTSTDGFDDIERTTKDFAVIYAPHFSFPIENSTRAVSYSTFLANGELILEFAKNHPEIKWIFKPHPRLRWELEDTGVWTKVRIDNYYNEWEKVAQTCFTSDYQSLFVNSDIMLTDCGSFLSEYACTEKPILRMVSPHLNVPVNPVLEKMYSTYYMAHNNEELKQLMQQLIIEKEDPNKEVRESAIEEVGLSHTHASATIKAYLYQYISK